VIAEATRNGIQIVPEIDTPAHVRSWGLSPEWSAKNITVLCDGGTGYNEQLDLSIQPDVLNLAKDVITEITQLFSASPYIHLGGDEVVDACWDKRPAIQEYMNANNISSYG
jgi:hexosaminidase